MQRASSGSGEADGDGHYSGASEAGRITTGKPGSGTSHPPSLTWDDPERIKLLHALEEMDVLNRWRPGLNTALWEQVRRRAAMGRSGFAAREEFSAMNIRGI